MVVFIVAVGYLIVRVGGVLGFRSLGWYNIALQWEFVVVVVWVTLCSALLGFARLRLFDFELAVRLGSFPIS